MSKWIKILLGAAALLMVGVFAALLLIDAEQFRPALQTQLEKALARPVTLGRLSHSIFPLSLRVGDLKVGEDPQFGRGTFMSAKEVGVGVKLWPLLSKRVEIAAVKLVEPKIELIRRGGVWNYESLGGKREDSGSSGTQVQLGRVDILGAEVAATLDDALRVVYPKTNLSIADIAPDRARAQLSASGTLHGVTGELSGSGEWKAGAVAGSVALREGKIGKAAIAPLEAKFDLTPQGSGFDLRSLDLQLGKLALRAKGTMRDRGLDLNVELPRAPIADLVQLAAAFGQGLPPGLQANGEMEGKFKLQGTTTAPQLTGRINATDLKLSGGAVKQEVRSRAVTIDLLPEAVRSSPFEVTCGRTKLSGYFSVRDYGTKPLLESAVITENADLADLVQIAQAYGAAEPGLRGSGKATLHLRIHGVLATGSTLQLAGKSDLSSATIQTAGMTSPLKVDRAGLSFPSPSEGMVSIGRLELDRMVLTSVQAKTSFRQGIVRLDPLTANLFGGSASGAVAINTRGPNSTISLDARVAKVESSQLIAAFSKLPEFISGPLTADIRINLAPRGNEDLLRTVTGNMAVKFAGGKLHTVNLLGELKSIARFLGGPKLDERFTSFVGMQGDLAFDNGVATTKGLKFDLKDAIATFTGAMNCLDQSLNLKMLSVLSPDLSEAVGGSRIGGILTVAMRNAAREIVIPAMVTGTFARPKITPDAPELARLKLRSTVPILTEDPGGVVDIIKGGKESMKDVLDILRGGGKKKE